MDNSQKLIPHHRLTPNYEQRLCLGSREIALRQHRTKMGESEMGIEKDEVVRQILLI